MKSRKKAQGHDISQFDTIVIVLPNKEPFKSLPY